MRLLCVSPVLVSFLALLACAQPTAPPAEVAAPAPSAPAGVTPPAMKPEPKLSPAEMESFLKTAPITARKNSSLGTTKPMRATLSDGKLTHDAQIQCVDEYRPVWKGAEGSIEKNFRDSWKFNVAAYRLSRILGIGMVPMSVERTVDGKQCSVTWWVDNVWLVEVERRDKNIKPPATDHWVNQLNTIRVFDQLIYNTDRNQGNLLITPEWNIWMIDHTRAFRVHKTLLKQDSLKRIDGKLLQALKGLTAAKLKQELGPWLRPEEIDGILARRDAIVSFYAREVREKGEEAVITGLPKATPNVSVP